MLGCLQKFSCYFGFLSVILSHPLSDVSFVSRWWNDLIYWPCQRGVMDGRQRQYEKGGQPFVVSHFQR